MNLPNLVMQLLALDAPTAQQLVTSISGLNTLVTIMLAATR
jgi:hypothetical protein